jgi:hypothetical protein
MGADGRAGPDARVRGGGPRGLGEGGRPQRTLVPVPESHRGAGLELGGAGLVRGRSR